MWVDFDLPSYREYNVFDIPGPLLVLFMQSIPGPCLEVLLRIMYAIGIEYVLFVSCRFLSQKYPTGLKPTTDWLTDCTSWS